jgi:hypothetical protein
MIARGAPGRENGSEAARRHSGRPALPRPFHDGKGVTHRQEIADHVSRQERRKPSFDGCLAGHATMPSQLPRQNSEPVKRGKRTFVTV